MAKNHKFMDCADCINKKRKDICASCDSGELFEDSSVKQVRVRGWSSMRNKSSKDSFGQDYDYEEWN